jgi:ADP-ribose pyrophosphatase YjhB (NUDIX family)
MRFHYCPKCGGKLELVPHHGVSQLSCVDCGFVFYQNSKPTASVFIFDADHRVLLAKRAVEPFKGKWDVPGGFLEYGEDPETGAYREIIEETSLNIEITDFVGIFMDTYGPEGEATLNIYYTARRLSGEAVPQDDVAELKWFPLDDLPQMAFKNSQESLDVLKAKFLP